MRKKIFLEKINRLEIYTKKEVPVLKIRNSLTFDNCGYNPNFNTLKKAINKILKTNF